MPLQRRHLTGVVRVRHRRLPLHTWHRLTMKVIVGLLQSNERDEILLLTTLTMHVHEAF